MKKNTCKHIHANSGIKCGLPQFHLTRHSNGLFMAGKGWGDDESTPESRFEDDKDRAEGAEKQHRI